MEEQSLDKVNKEKERTESYLYIRFNKVRQVEDNNYYLTKLT